MKRSSLIIPLSVFMHLTIINLALNLLTPVTYLAFASIVYYNLSWLLISYGLNFYPISRNERFRTSLNKLFYQYLIFGLSYFAFFGFKEINNFLPLYQLNVLVIIFSFISLNRWLFHVLIRVYRLEGGNSVNVVVVGIDKNLEKIEHVFNTPELGYRYKGYFGNKKSSSRTYLGPVEDSYQYIMQNSIDEIYCMASQLSSSEIRSLINFADNNLKRLKIIPDNKEIFNRIGRAHV